MTTEISADEARDSTLGFLQRYYNVDCAPFERLEHGRDDLARLFEALSFTRGAEIGVERGEYAEVLCQRNPNLHLYAIDAWQPYRGYRDHVNAEKLDRFYVETLDRLKPYQCTVMRRWSVDAAAEFEDESLDFVYLDSNHRLESVIADLGAWAPKVRPGGVVAGHDWKRYPLPNLMHVPQAVTAWVDAYQTGPILVLAGDSSPSWLFVNKPLTKHMKTRRPIKQ